MLIGCCLCEEAPRQSTSIDIICTQQLGVLVRLGLGRACGKNFFNRLMCGKSAPTRAFGRAC